MCTFVLTVERAHGEVDGRGDLVLTYSCSQAEKRGGEDREEGKDEEGREEGEQGGRRNLVQ